MGLMGGIFNIAFGNGQNAVRETVEVFRENAEAASARASDLQATAMQAYAAEFAHARRGRFDRFMDGLNRLPRPALALSTIGLFAAAMAAPDWFAVRMQSVALVPEPLWWLMGAIVSFYFGARHQVKGQEFQRSIAQTLARAPVATVTDVSPSPEATETDAGQAATQVQPFLSRRRATPDTVQPKGTIDTRDNAALRDWQVERNGR